MKVTHFALGGCFAVASIFLTQSGGLQNPSAAWAQSPDEFIHLSASYTTSGTFTPAPVDTNKDGFSAVLVTEELNGFLEGAGAGELQNIRLTTHTTIVEYGLLDPATDACTSCFRVNEHDFSVQENAYQGPLAQLIRPIRDPVQNPSSSSYSAEEWTAFYRLETGELIYAQVTELQICVENVQPPESLVPICHVKSREIIIGGTGRFKHATGDVYFTSIAPTFTSHTSLLDEEGCIDLSRPPAGWAFGPIYGVGQMNLHVPVADAR